MSRYKKRSSDAPFLVHGSWLKVMGYELRVMGYELLNIDGKIISRADVRVKDGQFTEIDVKIKILSFLLEHEPNGE